MKSEKGGWSRITGNVKDTIKHLKKVDLKKDDRYNFCVHTVKYTVGLAWKALLNDSLRNMLHLP